MRSKRLCSSDAGDKEKDGDEGKDGTDASTLTLSSTERCPICLNSLSLEVGFPEDCCHAFCISCILKWCETSSSCPVDRKPFQTVYKIDPFGGCTKIHVVARTQKENCSCNLCQWCCTKGKICFRTDVIKKYANEVMTICAKDGCKDDGIIELQLRNQSYDGLCLAGDFMVASVSDPAEMNHINRHLTRPTHELLDDYGRLPRIKSSFRLWADPQERGRHSCFKKQAALIALISFSQIADVRSKFSIGYHRIHCQKP